MAATGTRPCPDNIWVVGDCDILRIGDVNRSEPARFYKKQHSLLVAAKFTVMYSINCTILRCHQYNGLAPFSSAANFLPGLCCVSLTSALDFERMRCKRTGPVLFKVISMVNQ